MRTKTQIAKKLLSIILCLAMLMSYVPATVFAVEGDAVCACVTKCADGSVNSECPVCSAEGADLSGCVGEEASDDTNPVTIYFDNALGWKTVNAYYWSESNFNMTAWPGDAMTNVEGNIWSYDSVPADAVSVIFNDGSSQTNDLTIPTDGKDCFKATDATEAWYTGFWYDYPCSHSFTDGTCAVCGKVCSHESYEDGKCTLCDEPCDHAEDATYIDNGDGTHSFTCTVCGTGSESHTITDGACAACGAACPHSTFADGVCATCGITGDYCDINGHTISPETFTCTACEHSHYFVNGLCDCGVTISTAITKLSYSDASDDGISGNIQVTVSFSDESMDGVTLTLWEIYDEGTYGSGTVSGTGVVIQGEFSDKYDTLPMTLMVCFGEHSIDIPDLPSLLVSDDGVGGTVSLCSGSDYSDTPLYALAGSPITVTAGTKDGQVFSGWTVGDGAGFSAPTLAEGYELTDETIVLSLPAGTAACLIAGYTCRHETVDEYHCCEDCYEWITDQCIDENNDHMCDGCGWRMEWVCEDGDTVDHVCDGCGSHMGWLCEDGEDEGCACDVCGTSLCREEYYDGDHACEDCGLVASECYDDDYDLICDECGAAVACTHPVDFHEATGNGDGTHSYTCDTCEEVVTADCVFDYANNWDETGHWSACYACGSDDPTNDEVSEHTYEDSYYYIDETHHYPECDSCWYYDESGAAKHTFEDGWCTVCELSCEHSESNHSDNGDGTHNELCKLCGYLLDENQDHDFTGDGKCVCGVQAQAKIGETYYATLAQAAAEVTEGDSIAVLTDVTIAEGETLAFASFATLNVAEGKTVTCDGTVTIGESDGIIFENTLYYYGGDLTEGASAFALPPVSQNTCWTAGEGHITYMPDSNTLTLKQASANFSSLSSHSGAFEYYSETGEPTLTINFYGSNTITAELGAVFYTEVPVIMNGMGENAVLNIMGGESNTSAVGAHFAGLTVNSGTVTIRSGSGEGSCSGASVAGTLTVAPGAVLNAAGGESLYDFYCGLGAQAIEAEGTINGLVTVVDESGAGYYQVYGNTVLEYDLTTVIEEAQAAYPFSVPAGTSLTVNSGVTLDLSGLTLDDIDFSGTIVNNGTILLPEGFTIPDTLTGGTVTVGDDSYTWNGEKWVCPEGGHIPVADSCTDKGDGTHSYTCGLCGGTDTEDHTYVDGVCVCGAECPHSNFDATTGYCTDCETLVAIAKVECGGTTTYYQTADGLHEAVENKGADQTVTLLADSVIERLIFHLVGTKNTLDLNGYTLTCNDRIEVDSCELTITGTGTINAFMTADLEGSKIVVGSEVTLNGTLRSVDGAILDLTGATIPETGLTVILYTEDATYNISDVLKLPADHYFFVDGKAVSSYSVETEGTVKKHTEHSYTYSDNGDGTHKKVCIACGYVEIASEAHSTTADGDRAATCTAKAYCSVCESYYGDVDKTNHTKQNTTVKDAKEATCSADGYTGDTYCECGEKIADGETIPATGEHNYTVEVEGSRIPATCMAEGSVTMKCTCGATEVRTLEIDKTNHEGAQISKYNDTKTHKIYWDCCDAVVTAEEAHAADCKCGIVVASVTLWYADITSHGLSNSGDMDAEYLIFAIPDEDLVVTAKTDFGTGMLMYAHTGNEDNEIIIYGDTGNTMTVPAVWVDEDLSEIAVMATVDLKIKLNGGKILDDLDEETLKTNNIRVEDGCIIQPIYYNLSNYTDVFFEKEDHELSHVVDENGYRFEWYKSFIKCGAYTEDVEAEAIWICSELTHVEAIAATCVATGNVEHWKCGCGKLYSDAEGTTEITDVTTVDKDNHTKQNTTVKGAVDATCGADGYTGDTYCECGEKIADGETIPATGEHNFATEVEGSRIPATCMETGSVTMKCDCGATEVKTLDIDKTNHTKQNTTIKDAKEATCGADGYTGDTYCECGEKIADGETIPATGEHNYATEVAGSRVDGTCMAEGFVTMKCTCGATEVQTLPIDKDNHTGKNHTEGAKDPDCENKGYTGDTVCECGVTIQKGEDISATNHNWDAGVVTKEPTCSAKGEKLFTCQNDASHTYTEDVEIVADAHKWDEGKVTTVPTCKAEGVKTFTCQYNSTHTYTETLDKNPDNHTGETYVKGQLAPGCATEGYTGDTHCGGCDKLLKEGEVISATGEHNYATEVAGSRVDATCMATGSVTMQCTCGATEVQTLPIDEDNHTGNNYTEGALAPECENKGYTGDTVCECGVIIEKGEDISATNHNWDEGVMTKEPTCSAKGEKTFTCQNDATHTYTEDMEIVADAHKWNAGVITTKPTCNAEGEKTFTCQYNSTHTYTKSVEKDSENHVGETYLKGEVAPGCVTEGYTGDTHCGGCDKLLVKGDVISATGEHNYGAEVPGTRKDATCMATGSVTMKCICGDSKVVTLEIDSDNHTGNNTLRDAAKATCESDGYTGDTYCECGKKIASGEAISAIGHKMVETSAKVEATCEDPGKTAILTCANECGKTEGGEVISAIGHKMVETSAKVEATCEDPGKTAILTCANECGKTEGGEVISATGHNYRDGSCIDCGMEDPAQPALFHIEYANMTLGNSLAMNFAFAQSHREDWSGCSVRIVKEYADGRADQVVDVPYSEWTQVEINGGAYWRVKFNGVAAKEMSDSVYVTVYDADGKAISNLWEDSVRAYAMRMLNNRSSTQEAMTMAVDMLNYGAAAQNYFGYNTDDLANNQLSAAHQALATKEAKAADNRVSTGNYLASNLGLESQILFRMAFTGVTADMYATIEFTSHTGRAVCVHVDGSQIKQGVVVIDEIVIADGRMPITVTVYNADGSVYASATDSMESYIARMSQKDVLFEMILKFSDSAYNYFH